MKTIVNGNGQQTVMEVIDMKTTTRRILLSVFVLTVTMVLCVTLEYVCAELRHNDRATVFENLVLDQVAAGYNNSNLAF